MASQRPLIRSTTHRTLPVDDRLDSEPVGTRLLDAGLLNAQQVRTVLNLQMQGESMVSFQVSGQPALRFKVAARAVLFAGSRRGQVEQPVCRALVERFRRHGFGFFVGCATGVDAAFRAALAHSACGPDEVFVGCAFGKRARRCRAEGLFASAVVPEGIPPRAALARRTLWLVKRSSLVVLFPERPADRQWGPGSRLAYRSALYHLKPTFVVASRPPVAPAFCRVAAADLFATVDGYWVVPHTFRDGLCDDEY